MNRSGSTDLRLTVALNRFGVHAPALGLFRAVSRLGDGVFWYLLMALMASLGGWHGLVAALHMGVTALFCAALYRMMKRHFRRPRPFRTHAVIVARIHPLDEYSFPSGHTLHAVSFSIIAIAYYPALVWLLVPFSILVAISRVVLGMHYPSDVLAASAIAVVIAGGSLGLV